MLKNQNLATPPPLCGFGISYAAPLWNGSEIYTHPPEPKNIPFLRNSISYSPPPSIEVPLAHL